VTASAELDPAVGLWIELSDQGTTTTIALHGEWDLAQQDAARHAIQLALAREPERVVLDLTGLTFMDSTGIHGVIELARGTARLKANLVVILGSRVVRRLFEICQPREPITIIKAA
jgi:anti-sigma B factor antagonist